MDNGWLDLRQIIILPVIFVLCLVMARYEIRRQRAKKAAKIAAEQAKRNGD